MWFYLRTPILCLHSSRLHGWVIAGWFWDMQGEKKAMTKKLEKKKKKKKKEKPCEFTQNGSFIQPSLKMIFHCPGGWTCWGSWDDHLGWSPGGGGARPWLSAWSMVRTAACSARFLCCYCCCFSWALCFWLFSALVSFQLVRFSALGFC